MPFELFEEWYNQTSQEPTSVALATATSDGSPSVRMVLLKGFSEKGFIFYGNISSRKAQHLTQNPKAALCFYWDEKRQVRVEGKVLEVPAKIADEYFASRSRESQLSAWASKQSQTLKSEQEFTDAIALMEKKFHNQPIWRPPFWAGWLLEPVLMEFWERGTHRRHKRIVYEKIRGKWQKRMLYP